jgi:XTP/dITP diphosphohydrolase
MRILLATSNPHKLEEVRQILANPEALDDGFASGRPVRQALIAQRRDVAGKIDLQSLASVGFKIEEPVEDKPTFEGNAVLKAAYYAKATGIACLADDSGLEVDVLGGKPGVISARYAGVRGPRSVADPANNALLLENLKHVAPEDRTARFVCAMALCAPDRLAPLAVVRGVVHGKIIPDDEPPRGEHGFGYDPLFLIEELGVTTAELDPEQKNAISHRGRATRLLLDALGRLAGFQ